MIYLSTLEAPPPGHRIESAFGIVETTSPLRISAKGLIESLVTRNTNDHDKALETLMRAAPEGANAILGIRHSTAVWTSSEGTFLYLTYIGSPVRIVEDDQ